MKNHWISNFFKKIIQLNNENKLLWINENNVTRCDYNDDILSFSIILNDDGIEIKTKTFRFCQSYSDFSFLLRRKIKKIREGKMFFNKRFFSEEEKTFDFIFRKIRMLTALRILKWELFLDEKYCHRIVLKTKNKVLIDSNEYFIFICIDDDFDFVFKISENFESNPHFRFIVMEGEKSSSRYNKMNNFYCRLRDKLSETDNIAKKVKFLKIKEFQVIR